MKKIISSIVFLIIMFAYSNVLAAIWYVDQNAIGFNNGTSWENAYTTIQAVFDNEDLGPGDEILVKEGVYYESITINSQDSGGELNPVILKASNEMLEFTIRLLKI